MGRDDWVRVCESTRTAQGLFWPIPITLSTDDESIKLGAEIALADPEDGAPLAIMKVTEKYTVAKAPECGCAFRTPDPEHPALGMVLKHPTVTRHRTLPGLSA